MHSQDDVFHVYTLSAFAAVPDVVKLDPDADFELQRLSCFFSPDGSPQTESSRRLPSVLFNILDTATGRNVFAGDADTAELFGDGSLTFVLPTTHWFRRGSRMEVTFSGGPDLDNGSLWLAFIGRKRFRYGQTAP